jgi:hypothetical protein
MTTQSVRRGPVLAGIFLLLVTAVALLPAMAPTGAAAQGAYPDYDGDGLSDADEYYYGTHPMYVDSDGDGLTDGQEVYTYGTYPTYADSDGDGYYDGEEVYYGYDPLVPLSVEMEVDATYGIYEGAAISAAISEQGELDRDNWEETTCNAYMEDNSCGS